ncbi:Dihydropteroate synthase [Arboricoccus pini]|uniref:Dihydropteroate synthase n=1 Tax=Arboricoccus pini TaxID=1963835 RepID=A0A212RE82_9PROT|nr:dihydropteroate synthase [Arboricoccus pini]SNB70524.1 Dihydropteroate synthase [Arboricoccus pini]
MAEEDPFTRLFGVPAPWLFGVLNVTPNSFSDGGAFLGAEAAIAQGRQLMQEGAAAIDIGGESTAPGRPVLEAEEEIGRIEAVVRTLAPETVLSIDTYHARTAARSLELGARIINDVSALRADPELARVVAAHDAGLILMHAKDGPLPHVTAADRRYDDVVAEIAAFLLRQAEVAIKAGVAPERIVVDPAASSFISHDPEDTWRVLAGFERFVELVAPFKVMIATSRKGFMPIRLSERDPISQLTALVAAMRGASLIRTHNVAMARDFVIAARKMGLLPAIEGGTSWG